jgi:hypothetical protein
MTQRQYIACAFRPGDRKTYSYHNDGPAVAVGDRVVVFSRGRESRVSVEAILDKPPPGIETKAILRMVDQPPDQVPPANSTAMLELPEDELPI